MTLLPPPKRISYLGAPVREAAALSLPLLQALLPARARGAERLQSAPLFFSFIFSHVRGIFIMPYFKLLGGERVSTYFNKSFAFIFAITALWSLCGLRIMNIVWLRGRRIDGEFSPPKTAT